MYLINGFQCKTLNLICPDFPSVTQTGSRLTFHFKQKLQQKSKRKGVGGKRWSSLIYQSLFFTIADLIYQTLEVYVKRGHIQNQGFLFSSSDKRRGWKTLAKSPDGCTVPFLTIANLIFQTLKCLIFVKTYLTFACAVLLADD